MQNTIKQVFFGIYYDEIFQGLNAAQMILAVIIFRYCDRNRKRVASDEEVRAFRPYSNYIIASLVGKRILLHYGVGLNELNHNNFDEIKTYLENNIDTIISAIENTMKGFLKDYFSYLKKSSLVEIDGRTMSELSDVTIFGKGLRIDVFKKMRKRYLYGWVETLFVW